jgi:hypothetical protein
MSRSPKQAADTSNTHNNMKNTFDELATRRKFAEGLVSRAFTTAGIPFRTDYNYEALGNFVFVQCYRKEKREAQEIAFVFAHVRQNRGVSVEKEGDNYRISARIDVSEVIPPGSAQM